MRERVTRVRTSSNEVEREKTGRDSTRLYYYILSKLVPKSLLLLLMQWRGDVTYDVSCTRATWGVDRSVIEDSGQFLLVDRAGLTAV